MVVSAEVIGVAKTETPWGSEKRTVTLSLDEVGLKGTVTLEMPPHEAKPYTLGRMVDVTIQPRKVK